MKPSRDKFKIQITREGILASLRKSSIKNEEEFNRFIFGLYAFSHSFVHKKFTLDILVKDKTITVYNLLLDSVERITE